MEARNEVFSSDTFGHRETRGAASTGAPKAKRVKMDLLTKGSCGKKTIQDLPDEVLCLVFSFLGLRDLVLGAKKVCRRWKVVADDNSLWKALSLSYNNFEHKEILNIVKVSPKLRWLRCDTDKPPVLFFKTVVSHCTELRGLSVSRLTTRNEKAFETLMRNCPRLEYVDISSRRWKPKNFPRMTVHCRNLKELKLDLLTAQSGVLDSVTEGCPLLQSLTFRCAVYSGRDVSSLVRRMGHNLKELCFDCCINQEDNVSCVLPVVAECCRKLEILKIWRHSGDLHSLREFFENGNAQNLRELCLTGFQFCDESLCTAISQNAPNLSSLTLSYHLIGDITLEIIGKLSNLTILKLQSNVASSDKAITHIVRCKKLKLLHLPFLKGTDKNFATLCAGLPLLEDLLVSVTDISAKSLLVVPDMLKNLRHLEVRCRNLDDVVKSLKSRMPFLKTVDVF